MKEKILFLGYVNSPLIAWLESYKYIVVSVSDKISFDYIQENRFDYLISYGYRYIISKDIIEYFDNKGINLHISFLPWNKGADPNLWSFVDNTKKGVTIHYLDVSVDSGDIIVQKEVEFDMQKDTLSTSYNKLQQEVQSLFKENWELIRTHQCNRNKQVGEGSYHKSKDKKNINHLITNSWDTLVSHLVDKNK